MYFRTCNTSSYYFGARSCSKIWASNQKWEVSHTVKTIFFDKTGTLTTGEFLLEKFEGTALDYQILASLEAYSIHPLAKSVTLDAYWNLS